MPPRSLLPNSPWYFGPPCALAGLVLACFMVFCAQGLGLGAPAARAAAGLLLLLPLLLALCLLRYEGCPLNSLLLLILPITVALYLRLLCLDHQTLDYQTFLAQWAAFFRDNGGFAALKQPVGNYNVVYLYFLAAISYLPIPDLYLIKLFSILFDVLLAWGGLRLTRPFCKNGSPAPLLCFTLLLFLPTVILNGAFWGQCDSMYVSLLLLGFSAALAGYPKTSVLLAAFAFSCKLQAVFLLPLWGALWLAGSLKLRHALLFPVGYGITILPALALGKPLGDILGVYVDQVGEYSGSLSLNSPSVFSFLPYGVQIDQTLAARLGIAAAFLLVLTLLGLLLIRRRRLTPGLLLSTAVLLAIGVPFLLPHMHDRYFFLADALTLVWACVNWKRFPIALLVQISSLSCYSTYLNLRYTLPFSWNGLTFPMAFEGALMLAALALSGVIWIRQWRALSPRRAL